MGDDGYERVVYGIIGRAYWDSRGKPFSGRPVTAAERRDGFLFFYDGRYRAWAGVLGLDAWPLLDEIERLGGGKVGQDWP